jgi:integrase
VRFRLKRNLTRTYLVHFRGKWEPGGRTLPEALVRQGELKKSVLRGEAPVLTNKTTFRELAEEWYAAKSTRVRQRTASYYRDALDLVLIPRWGRWRIAAVDADAISKLVRDLQRDGLHAIDPKRKKRPLGHSSVENYLKPAQQVLAMAVRRKLISSNPFDVLTADDRPAREEKQAPHEWTTEEVEALLDASRTLGGRSERRYDYSPILRVVSTLGLRCGEALGLRWEDFDREASTLTVARQWGRDGAYGPPKTKAGVRRIALPADLRDELIALRLRSSFSQDSDPIFASNTGTPMTHRNVTRRGFEAARDLAALPTHLTFHSLRHAAASRLIVAGLDPVTVAAVLGHEDATTTLKVYAHLYDRQKSDEAVRLALAGVTA